jgi:hypothetical protein
MSDSKIQKFREKVEVLARESGLTYKELSEILSFLSYRYAFFWSCALGSVEIGPSNEVVSTEQ